MEGDACTHEMREELAYRRQHDGYRGRRVPKYQLLARLDSVGIEDPEEYIDESVKAGNIVPSNYRREPGYRINE